MYQYLPFWRALSIDSLHLISSISYCNATNLDQRCVRFVSLYGNISVPLAVFPILFCVQVVLPWIVVSLLFKLSQGCLSDILTVSSMSHSPVVQIPLNLPESSGPCPTSLALCIFPSENSLIVGWRDHGCHKISHHSEHRCE